MCILKNNYLLNIFAYTRIHNFYKKNNNNIKYFKLMSLF